MSTSTTSPVQTDNLADLNPSVSIFGELVTVPYDEGTSLTVPNLTKRLTSQMCTCIGTNNNTCPLSWMNIQDPESSNTPLQLLQVQLGKVCNLVQSVIIETINNKLMPVTQKSAKTQTLLQKLKNNIADYNSKRTHYNTQLQKIFLETQQLTNTIEDQRKQIQALQKKVNLAYRVLQAEGSKLQDLTHNYSTFKTQNNEAHDARVPIGLPFLDPFFTMTQRDYVIMMLCFIALLVVAILVYAFVRRKRFTADVTSGKVSAPTDARSQDVGGARGIE